MSNSFIMTESIVRPAKMPYGRLKDNGFVGIEGEHAARALVVETKDDLSAFASVNLIIDDLDCGAMTKTTSGGTTTLSMTLTSSMIGRSGRKICQLIMVNSGNTVVQKSSQFEAYVGRANEIERSVDDGVTIIILSEAVTEMAQEAAAAAAQEAVADVVADCQDIADAASASADAAAQSASDAQTAAASIVVDSALDATSTHALQNKVVTSEINGLKADLGDLSELETTAKTDLVAAINEAARTGGGSGLTDAVKTALMNLANHIGVWTDGNAQTYIDALEDALYPPATLVSISAVYTQTGVVYNNDSLTSLKSHLIVTGTYDNNTTSVISGSDYTLSGTLTVGTSTITVTCEGLTDTFDVTVSQYVGPGTLLHAWDFTTGYEDTVGNITGSPYANATRDSSGLHFTGQSNSGVVFAGALEADITVEVDISSTQASWDQPRLFMFDDENGFIFKRNNSWQWYLSGWKTPTTPVTDRDYFNGKMLVIKIPSTGIPTAYDGNGNVIADNASVDVTATYSNIILGAKGAAFYSITITGMRIYRGVE